MLKGIILNSNIQTAFSFFFFSFFLSFFSPECGLYRAYLLYGDDVRIKINLF